MPYLSEKVLLQRDKDSFDAGYKAGAGVNEINAEMLTALKGLSDMYGWAWDLVDGGLLMTESGVPRFEAAHRAAQIAIQKAEGTYCEEDEDDAQA